MGDEISGPSYAAVASSPLAQAAEDGNIEAQYALGLVLTTELHPPELGTARIWWTRAAKAGHPGAQYGLGVLLATRLDPPELTEARV